MARKSFLQMHNEVGGSYSSSERAQQEKERQQTVAQKQEQVNQQTIEKGQQKKAAASSQRTSPVAAQFQLLQAAAERKAPAQRQKKIGELEQSIAALQAQKAPLDQWAEAGNSEFDDNGQLTEKGKSRQELNQQIKEQQAHLDSLTQKEKLYQRQQEADNMVISAAKDPNFASKSTYTSTKQGDGLWDRFGTELTMGYGDLLYEYINNQEEGIRDQIRQQKPNYGGSYDLMTDDEVALYNYYYSTGGKEAAQKYLDLIEDTVNQRKGSQMAKGLEGNVGRELLFGIGAGLDQFSEGIEGAISAAKGEDSYQAPSARQYASSLVREDLADSGAKLPDWLGGSSLGQSGYDVVTNIAHMAPTLLASGAANALAPGSGAYVANALTAASSGGSAYQEAINQGYSADKARNYAAVMGASEAAMQYALGGIEAFGGKLSGNAIEKAIEGVGNGVAKAALKTGLNMASEGLEEGVQEALEPVFGRIFLGSEENVDWSQVAYSAVLGALTAGIMEGPKTFANARNVDQAETTTTQPTTQQSQDTQSPQQATEVPLQGEPADPRHVAAQQEQTAQSQQDTALSEDVVASNPIQDTLLNPLDQEQTQPNPALENLSPYPTPDTAQPQQVTEIDPLLEGIQQPPVAQQQTDIQSQSPQPMQQTAESQSTDTKIEAESTPAGESPKNGSLATPINSASGTSMPASGENVNGNVSTFGAQQDPYAPGIESVGAAPRDFTGKTGYYDLLSDQNSQPDRATDARPMELPKTDISGNPISEVTGNAYASKFTPDEFASLMEEPTARGDFSYAKITNDQATQRAIDTISAAGDWESAYNQWAKDVGAGKAGAEMSARGALFLNHFAQEGNKTQWLNTLADMQDLGTNTAQGLQAMRLIRELNPPDKIRFVEMATKRLGQKMGVDFTVDQSLYDAYNNATTDEARNTALDNIEQAVADQIPSTVLDKWNALRYTNMLGNLKTNVRNIAGNVGAGAMYRGKDQIAATMEGVLYKATGGKFERTKSHTVSQELLNACKQDFDQVSGIVSDGGKYGTQGGFFDQFTQGVMDKRRIFKSDNKVVDTLLTPLEGYRKGTDWMMNNQYFGDEAFGKAAYARSLAGYLKAHGVTDTDLSKVDTGLMDKARAYAVREAQEATFHDNSALARIASATKRNWGVIGEGIMPFTKTPANVLTRAEEFSPLGFINTAVDAAKAAKGTGDVTGVDVVNSLAKSLTGTGIFALGAWLRSQGFLTGGPDGDEDKDYFDQLNGDQNYAIRFTVGGKTYNFTLDWLTPAAMPLFMGGQFMDILEKGFENLTFADLENVFTSIADPMLQMSMLQSLNDSLDNIKYTDNNLGQFFINAAVSYLTQGFANTMLGQIERSTEKNRMTTYVDKDSQVPAWMQRQLGSLSQKIPGWDYHQVEYRNSWGETEENEGGLLYNLLSPGYISEEKSNALSEELYRLNDVGVERNVFPDTPDTTVSYTDKNGDRHEDYNLTAAEADTLKEVSGRTSATLLSDLIESDMYNAMTDQQKADVVSTVYDYARELGRTEAIDGYDGMDSWMKDLEDNATSTILNKVVTSSFSDSFNSLTNSWNYGKDTGSAISGLDQAYSLYTTLSEDGQKQFREDNGGRIGYFLDAKEAGISTERFADLYSTYRSLDNNEDISAKEKAQQWSSTLAQAQKSGDLTKAQANTLKDSMVFRTAAVATAERFDNLVESGMSTESADKITHLLDGIKGTGKDGTVRPIDKYSAIAGSSLSAKDKETALYEYMPDAMDEKYTYAKENMGLIVDDFVKAYQVTDKYSLKDDQKEAWKAMGYTEAEAENLWQLYKGKLT